MGNNPRYVGVIHPVWGPVIMQHAQWRTSRDQLIFRAYNALNHPLLSADVGGFILAVVELRCLDVGQSPSTFSRVMLRFFFCSLTHIFHMSDCRLTPSSFHYFYWFCSMFHHHDFTYTCSPFIFRRMYFIHAIYMFSSYLFITCHASMVCLNLHINSSVDLAFSLASL